MSLNEVVNIHKPVGPSSFAMVQAVRKVLNVKKAGHIGTLDPLAEGVLPICLDRATRIIQFMVGLSKVYRATLTLGSATDTQDQSGKVLATADASGVTEPQVREALSAFVGEQGQIPPMFSAKKKNGVPLYKMARNGVTISRDPVTIHIYSLEFLGMKGNEVTFRTHCSSGTYIRTLCHDLGQKLGCGAHMSQLIRERVGSFDLKSSLTLDELKHAQTDGSLSGKLLQTDQALSFLPEIRISPDRVESIVHGVALTKSAICKASHRFKPGMNFRVTSENNPLVAIVVPLVDQDAFDTMRPDQAAFKLKRVLIAN